MEVACCSEIFKYNLQLLTLHRIGNCMSVPMKGCKKVVNVIMKLKKKLPEM